MFAISTILRLSLHSSHQRIMQMKELISITKEHTGEEEKKELKYITINVDQTISKRLLFTYSQLFVR